MTQLNQIIAVEKGTKAAAERAMTDAYHSIQRTPQLSGIARTYRPVNDDDVTLPSESTLVQVKVPEIIDAMQLGISRMFDVVLTKDTANQTAQADVVVDGTTILSDVPVTYLLFLEKQLVHFHTFVSKLPTLDPAQEWTWDAGQGVYRAEPVQTTKTKKILRNHVKAEATDKHPAQVETFAEDVVVGFWTKVDFSGAIPETRRLELLDRVAKLGTAVKFAREAANTQTVTDRKAGDAVLSYLFG